MKGSRELTTVDKLKVGDKATKYDYILEKIEDTEIDKNDYSFIVLKAGENTVAPVGSLQILPGDMVVFKIAKNEVKTNG